jgi:phage terminase large subunit
MYQKTTATTKLLALTKRIRGISGGTSASKTISILLLLIDYGQSTKNELISVVSETMPHLRKGAMRDFENIMKEHRYWRDGNWNATNSIYTFETGTKLEFFSADQPDRVRGPRRDILFVNEANNITYETFTQLEIRTRKIIWLDWNPVAEFWFYTDVKGKNDVDFLVLTYKDNEALEISIIASIEARKANKNWWLVYGEGLLGEAEGRIYTGWHLDMEEVPPEARLERYGLDFGYTNDPTAIIAIYKWNNAYILDEITYLKGLKNKNIFDIFSNISKALVIADSSEPKSIDEIRGYGLNIIGATKGKDSINQGIQFVQDQVIFVTKRSTNIVKEYRNYLWMTNPDGKTINEAQDFLNHAMDAIRYGMDSFNQYKPFKQNNDVGGVKPYLPGLIA